MSLGIVILAAGRGTRFNSTKPKVLYELAGKPLLHYVLSAIENLEAKIYIVCGYQANLLKESFPDKKINWVEQKELHGTGHAVMQALEQIDATVDQLLVLNGDGPLIKKETLLDLVKNTKKDSLGLVTAIIKNPAGYGRIIRKDQKVCAIIEDKDANEDQRMVNEINGGVYLFPVNSLKKWINNLSPHNKQNEYYLTDVIYSAYHDGNKIDTFTILDKSELLGVNSFYQLSKIEKIIQIRQAKKLQDQGVYIVDHTRFDLRGDLQCGLGVKIDINNLFLGSSKIGEGSTISANCVLKNVDIGKNVTILPFCHLEDSIISDNCTVGPFTRLRTEVELAENVHLGNFVEVKKSKISNSTKIGHLTYIGDSDIGKNVNVGAGTITCNYDGKNKNKTVIGDGAFVGSNVSLVAPLDIGKGAVIGAGSVITSDVPEEKLTLSRSEQVTIENWKREK